MGVTGLAGSPLDVLENAPAFVEVRKNSRSTDFRELCGLGLNGLLCLLFQVWQMQILKDQGCNLVDVDVGLVIVLPGLVARALTLSCPADPGGK